MATTRTARRPRGHIRQRGGSYQVLVYAGFDPLTGKSSYLTGSTTDRVEAERIRTRLLGQVEERRDPPTTATMGTALAEWLRTHEAEESTLEGYRGYVRRTIEPALGPLPIFAVTAKVLEDLYADLRRCRYRCRNGEPAVDHRTTRPHDCREVRHKRGPGRPGRGEHHCTASGCVVIECAPHRCAPMSASSIRQVHWIISAALAAAVRWEWIGSNPAQVARKPQQRVPQPKPPTAAEAARIIAAAWDEDVKWGMLVWLVMVTGMRRAEVLALRWPDVDLDAGVLSVRRNYIRTRSRGIEKDTKSHQMRRLALDADTVALLAEHRARFDTQARALGVESSADAFLFSHKPLHDVPADPSGVTHHYRRLCTRLNIDSHLHALRHYTATELLTAGVDLRTVAGRLGHGGGGATTLRVYAAWVGEADRRAAELISGRLVRPTQP